MLKRIATTLLMLWPALAMAQSGLNEIRVTDADINAGDNVLWTADNVYVLDGVVFVEEGATLTIDPGTVVKGETGEGNDASALVITRGAQIFAEGTPQNPIIFTSVVDDTTIPDDTFFDDRGLWGGVVLLGRASTNNPTEGGTKEIEGINEIVGENDDRAVYGGTDDDDSSGIIRYVSIRHTGINVGDQAGNEIQGLTLGAVGRGTVIEYVESFASGDDGFEFFGGTVNTKYLVSAFNEDDAFDWDEGFRGKGQFWFALQATDAAGRAAEMDGATGNEFFQPYAIPTIANATYVGPGVPSTAEGDGAEMLIFRDNSGGFYFNSIFTEYDAASGGLAVTVEDIDNTGEKTEDSRQRLEADQLGLVGNIWWDFGAGSTLADIAPQAFVRDMLAASGNTLVDPQLRGITRDDDTSMMLDPRPAAGSPALTGAVPVVAQDGDDDFFTPVDYRGAFGGSNWLLGWTALDQMGYVTTAIDEVEGAEVPRYAGLKQNYPNPFNPSTQIEFELERAQQVRLAVYDLHGREVAVLVDGVQPAGVWQVQFDARDLASGLYVYQLRTASRTLSKTMTLVK